MTADKIAFTRLSSAASAVAGPAALECAAPVGLEYDSPRRARGSKPRRGACVASDGVWSLYRAFVPRGLGLGLGSGRGLVLFGGS